MAYQSINSNDGTLLQSFDELAPAVLESAITQAQSCEDSFLRSLSGLTPPRRLAAMSRMRPPPLPRPEATWDLTGVRTLRAEHDAASVIFAQGDPCSSLLHLDAGTVRLSVLSHAGKEAVVAVVTEGQFFGEGCLAGQTQRMATATAMTPAVTLTIKRPDMVRQLHARPAFAERFLTHMLTRNIRIEEALIDQMFNSIEKRLARTLWLLARYGEPEATHRALPRVSQELLAGMVGTTRSRVNVFMNKFRKLGFIEYNNGALKINDSLLSVIPRD